MEMLAEARSGGALLVILESELYPGERYRDLKRYMINSCVHFRKNGWVRQIGGRRSSISVSQVVWVGLEKRSFCLSEA